eukprot:Protomagalhaensia_wolfi_Nauph_80__99@NODE_1055_length_1767_cov_713_259838_g799_i0_p3_GENE_NODE_1055_length_1767_cov_713_259838_g799_i0NODE_1055_length_1767_cov_713_259838_g799_i0_p3_ORF_typecomplete_len179_score18_80_NODE_1055_length_1767_cov_713_259838_g799_i012051741
MPCDINLMDLPIAWDTLCQQRVLLQAPNKDQIESAMNVLQLIFLSTVASAFEAIDPHICPALGVWEGGLQHQHAELIEITTKLLDPHVLYAHGRINNEQQMDCTMLLQSPCTPTSKAISIAGARCVPLTPLPSFSLRTYMNAVQHGISLSMDRNDMKIFFEDRYNMGELFMIRRTPIA